MPPEGTNTQRLVVLVAGFLISLISYYLLLYHIPRTEFLWILLPFTITSLVYLWVLQITSADLIGWSIAGAIILRVALFWAVPELSDDFYRFIWDGRLLNQGISPFAFLPSELMQNPDFANQPINQQLFAGLNSPDYFTIYPPVAQWVFVISSKLYPENILGNIMVMRSFILAAEIGSMLLIIKILNGYGIQKGKVLIYAWNPLVIIELTGNLHFEGIMIFFILLAIYGLQKKRWWWSAVALAMAIATKLIPLIFLPLLWLRLHWKKLWAYWGITAVVLIVLFVPLYNQELIQGMTSSLSLYFQKFEFNASIYYLIREIGFAVKGYNIIQAAGLGLAVAVFLIILGLSWRTGRSMKWPQAMLWALSIYLLLATTVHPWYITPLVALAVFSDLKFPIVWSFAVVVTYAGYGEQGYHENLYLVGTEYILVVIALFRDLKSEAFQANENTPKTV